MSADEHQHYEEHPDEVETLFTRLMCERLERWIAYAKERLAGSGVRILTTPGNDDPPAIDQVIREHGDNVVLLMEGEIYDGVPGHEMINTGYSNPTPWHTPREFPEEYLENYLEGMACRLTNPATAIFNIHVPPYDSGLDKAPLLDENLTVKTSVAGQMNASVGSTAVRDLIGRYQPLLSSARPHPRIGRIGASWTHSRDQPRLRVRRRRAPWRACIGWGRSVAPVSGHLRLTG